MKRLMMISAFALAMTGCIQDKIDEVEESCQAAADKAQDRCEAAIDDALAQFWEQIDKEIQNTFVEVGCTPEEEGVGDLAFDCSNTFLCPDNGEI